MNRIYSQKKDKILISGTGRCGTTFLILLFSLLGLDTGYNIHNFKFDISENCNSGMERLIDSPHTILKNPRFIEDIENIIQNQTINIRYMIIPIRDYSKSAQSRLHYGDQNGGLWNATDYESQIVFFHKIMANYMYVMTKYNIPTIFIDFDKMISNPQYLYDKLKPILPNISFYVFFNSYKITTLHQNKKLQNQIKNINTLQKEEENKK